MTRLAVLPALALLAGCAARNPSPAPAEPITEAPAQEATPTVVTTAPGGCPIVADPRGEARTLEALQAAVAGTHRSAENIARDPFRHPLETLGFMGLRDDMTVVELWPGGGWYTEILAPVLAERGQLVATNFDPEGPEDKSATRYGKRFRDRLAADPAVFGAVDVKIVDPPDSIVLGEPGSADLALTFRNTHGWVRDGSQDEVYAAVYDVLAPCGVLGIVQHRAAPGTDPATANTGYVAEEVVIAAAEEAGFVLAGRSEINANPLDTRDHPEGVWTLPPSLRLGDVDREKYEAIGESDRMTLRFVKPATATD